jgi:hypothetical protein
MAQRAAPPELSVTPENQNFKDHLKESKAQELKETPSSNLLPNMTFNSTNAKSIASKMIWPYFRMISL